MAAQGTAFSGTTKTSSMGSTPRANQATMQAPTQRPTSCSRLMDGSNHHGVGMPGMVLGSSFADHQAPRYLAPSAAATADRATRILLPDHHPKGPSTAVNPKNNRNPAGTRNTRR